MSTNNLSDKSSQINEPSGVLGDLKRIQSASRLKPWTDLDLNLTLHPIRNDIIPLKDDRAIKYAVRNLLLTNFYERPFNLGLGANLRGLLFEPADEITKQALRENIARTIVDGEQRVQLLFIDIVDDADTNSYRILVKFRIKEYDSNETVDIVLKRLR
jgi:phage baseplate assembly protein W|tara:strand:+ start:689 stop:1162 length:474 start_codon:yes stop_codon:yes gene_type:complete